VIRFTDRARERLARLIDHLDEDACLRLSRSGGSPLAPDYDLAIVELDSRAGDEGLIEADGIRVLMPDDPPGPLLIDFHDGPGPSGFQVHGEGAAIPSSGGSLEERVRRVIEDRVNPGVASHGGHITLVEVRDDVAVIEMEGGCQGCSLSQMTLRRGVERMIREAVPEILGVHDATDHASGERPFFES
jgi:Fe/S biogenesis protein NfuA